MKPQETGSRPRLSARVGRANARPTWYVRQCVAGTRAAKPLGESSPKLGQTQCRATAIQEQGQPALTATPCPVPSPVASRKRRGDLPAAGVVQKVDHLALVTRGERPPQSRRDAACAGVETAGETAP